MQVLFEDCKRVILLPQLVIMLRHFFDEFTILQNFPNMLNRLFSDKAVEFNSFESLWFNIYRINGVVVDKNGTAVIDGFQKALPNPSSSDGNVTRSAKG